MPLKPWDNAAGRQFLQEKSVSRTCFASLRVNIDGEKSLEHFLQLILFQANMSSCFPSVNPKRHPCY